MKAAIGAWSGILTKMSICLYLNGKKPVEEQRSMRKSELFEELKEQIKGQKITIVFPESRDARILSAAIRLLSEDLAVPILLGRQTEVEERARKFRFDITGMTILNPAKYPRKEKMLQMFLERRKGKITKEQAKDLLLEDHYFGTMLVYMDEADALVSGARTSTEETVGPALEIIRTRPGVSRASGAFMMMRDRGERFIFADCAINVNPTAQQLAEIAVESAKTADMFGIPTKVALLSFSTKGSGHSAEVDKVVEATRLAQQMAPHYEFDGELQFDAAFDAFVAKRKAKESPVAGQATVFVFPELQSGNIGYKIAQRLGNFEAVGPILQGLNKPISDLSRGCTQEDVYKTAIITANQVASQWRDKTTAKDEENGHDLLQQK